MRVEYLMLQLQKYHGNTNNAAQQGYAMAEVKVLFIFVFFTIFIVIAITNLSVVLRSYESFGEELLKYFTCESTGMSPGKSCSRSNFEREDPTAPAVTINFIVTAIYPLMTLIYVVKVADIKKFLNRQTAKQTTATQVSAGRVVDGDGKNKSDKAIQNGQLKTTSNGDFPSQPHENTVSIEMTVSP